MFKTILALATALIIAVTTFAATANAGGCNKRFSPSFQSQSHHGARRAHLSRQRVIAKKRAAAKRRIIAKKKAAAKRRIIAKKKAAAKRRIIAQKRAAAKKAQIAAAQSENILEDTNEASNEPFDKPLSVSALAGADTRYNDEDNTDSNENGDTEDDADTRETTEQTPVKTMETASTGEIGCKKYIPAAGLTITVPCTQ